MVNSDEFNSLSSHAVRLLVNLTAQYRGNNNGDLSATWAMMKSKGWRSKSTLWAALHELLDKRFIVQSRDGGKHRCCLYALTWRSIDECGGKLHLTATIQAGNDWMKNNSAARYAGQSARYAGQSDEKRAA
jgi:hypothetical protein